jgi:hypothetical protein
MINLWEDQPRVNIVPIMVGYALTYEIRMTSGAVIARPHNEKDAVTWCRENAYEYTVQHKHTP